MKLQTYSGFCFFVEGHETRYLAYLNTSAGHALRYDVLDLTGIDPVIIGRELDRDFVYIVIERAERHHETDSKVGRR